MKRYLLIIILAVWSSIPLSAQVPPDPSSEFAELKSAFVDASHNKNTKQAKSIATQLDEYMSHIQIVRSKDTEHNMVPYLMCLYDTIPLTTFVLIRSSNGIDTIQFQDGKWYITKELEPNMVIDLLCFEQRINNKNAKKIIGAIQKKYAKVMGEELAGKKGSVFFVKGENLYYAAIESKKIPAFTILSNNEVINYASCLKAILAASGIDASYYEIIGRYLRTSIDEHTFEANGINDSIAQRRVVTSICPKEDITPSAIVDELLQEKFMIAIMEDSKIGILTAIAMKEDGKYKPTHVRLRIPTVGEEGQRVQLTWDDFSNQVIDLVKVEIY